MKIGDDVQIHHGDCLEVMKGMADSSVDLVLTDPPYFKVKGDAWDNQWDKPAQFLAWLDQVVEQCARVLKPNGSLYIFASPQMAARVECKVRERLNVLNHIVWKKDQGRWNQACKEGLRGYFPSSERIIFAEHYGADNMAKGEAGYVAKCDELRGFVFEPLRKYLCDEFRRAGKLNTEGKIELNVACGFSPSPGGMASRHYFSQSQWCLPTKKHYAVMQQMLNQVKHGEYLRQEYETLRQEYETLRRPFNSSPDTPYTDVWEFETVKRYKGKHPCEKPQALLRHIITVSSNPGAVVLDCFMGTGSTGVACQALGRKFVGVEMGDGYFEQAMLRLGGESARKDSTYGVLYGSLNRS